MNYMKKKWIFSLAATLFMVACHNVNYPVSDETDATNTNDSTEVNYIHSDSIDRIIMLASDIRLYQMEGFFSDSSNTGKHDSLFNYVIKKDYGKLIENEKELLYFALGETKDYQKNYAPIKQPFRPIFTIEFNKGKQTAYFFVSLGTGEVAIADKNRAYTFYQIKNSSIIERWYDYVLKKRIQNKK